ncbi:MAG: LuxR C-terminal-related transcriptional regulator, partial [Actinomycetota bacterium]
LDDADLAAAVIPVLEPWRDHVALDGNGWWCDGPVALWLARLHAVRGDFEAAEAAARHGEPIARAINDARSLRALRDRVPEPRPGRSAPGAPAAIAPGEAPDLTPRELRVLGLMARGATNREIARQLSFSTGTIRADTTSIYRKLGARGRVDTVARAVALGLLPADPG